MAGVAVFVGGLFVAGCSGGSNTTPSGGTPTTTPTSTPTTAPTNNPQAAFPCGSAPATASSTLSTFQTGSAIAFPALGSCSSSITFQSGTTFGAGTSVNVVTSLAAPAGAPSPLPTNPAGSSAPQTLIFETLTVTAGSINVGTGATAGPAQSVTIANTGTCTTYAQSFATGGAWQGAGTGTLSGVTATFPASQNASPITLNAAGSPYYIAYLCY